MRKGIKTTAIVTVFLTTLLALALTAGASMGGFSAEPTALPENQAPGINTFFDLRVTPGQRQEIEVDITNYRDVPITIEMELYTAATSITGFLVFSPLIQQDDSLPFRFEDIASLPPEAARFEIPVRGTATVPITINVPNQSFDGVALGAIHVLAALTAEELDTDDMFIQEFASFIPVRLQMTDNPVETDFFLGEVGLTHLGDLAAFELQIHHTAARQIRGDARVSSWIYLEGDDEPLFTTLNMPIEFAPNAIFPHTLRDQAALGITPGNYFTRVRIEYDGRTWEFERNFTVTPAVAAAINEEAIVIGQQGGGGGAAATDGGLSPATIAIIAGLLIIIILLAMMQLKSRKGNAVSANNIDLNNMAPQPQPVLPAQESQPVAPAAPPKNGNSAFDQLNRMSKEDLAKLLAQMKEEQNGKSQP